MEGLVRKTNPNSSEWFLSFVDRIFHCNINSIWRYLKCSLNNMCSDRISLKKITNLWAYLLGLTSNKLIKQINWVVFLWDWLKVQEFNQLYGFITTSIQRGLENLSLYINYPSYPNNSTCISNIWILWPRQYAKLSKANKKSSRELSWEFGLKHIWPKLPKT